jgi:DNA-binding transcriptional MerR regulator
MEIKNRLLKPYTDKQKCDFIVEQNHRLGYTIQETSEALEAWGLTSEEIEEQEKQVRNNEIDQKIKELQEMSLQDVLEGNKENISLYLDVINGLEMSRPE